MHIIVLLVLVALVSTGAVLWNGTGKNAHMPALMAAEVRSYKNGVYRALGAYNSPAGEESIEISIMLADDRIASTTFLGNATNPGSVHNQTKFSEGYTALVVGKKIDDVALTVVNGSSLTPVGFMDALVKIKGAARI